MSVEIKLEILLRPKRLSSYIQWANIIWITVICLNGIE